jgi:hypothetical protein
MNAISRRFVLFAFFLFPFALSATAQQRPTLPQPRPVQPRPVQSQRPPGPRLVPMAETRLIMEGLAESNFRGVERLLQKKPADVETWSFLRGQALLIAETGNLLMIRPPRTAGESLWLQRAGDMRNIAGQLARAAGSSDYERSRTLLTELAQSCNRCHQSFRVTTRIVPFAEPPERKVSGALDNASARH